jgi:isopropylmalate/homocitrate/citramalate synthase
MLDLVGEVLIEDESLRDGLQIEQRRFSIEEKLHFIRGLESCGLRRIQVKRTSFSPDWSQHRASPTPHWC